MGAHAGIGTLPLVFFGTEEQKKKYLPKLAAAEMIGAYALSESTSGSDALNSRTRAVLSPDGKHYILNGEKMWITNADFADLFTIFAKVDGEKFTAFLVEKDFPGFSVGAEEKKMGIRGSSTAPLILNDCKVPVENVLGEIGKGHMIAFNILNVGRFKLGAVASAARAPRCRTRSPTPRSARPFGKPISDFGLIREKIGADGGRHLRQRVDGLSHRRHDGERHAAKARRAREVIRKAIEEYAVECSIIKVAGSEMLDFVVDETVQIYGGYGFVEEYPAERAYRDSRVNRIFEGTNEINRLIITGWLLKRAMSGQLALLPAIKKTMDEVMAGPSFDELEGALAAEQKIVGNAKKLAMLVAGAASQKYMQKLADQQEIMGAIADMVIESFAMDSCLLRARKHIEANGEQKSALVTAMTQIYIAGAMSARSHRQESDRRRGRRRHDAHPDCDRPPSGEVRARQRDRLAGADRRPRARNRQVRNGLGSH